MRSSLLASALIASTACAASPRERRVDACTLGLCTGLRGSGVIHTESRPVTEFNEVDVGGGFELVLRSGAPSLTLEGDDNLLPLYRSEVKDGCLHLHLREHEGLSPSRSMRVTVTTPRLRRVAASGGVDITFAGATDSRLSLDLSGGVTVKAASLDLEALEVDASGGVVLELGGRAQRAALDLSGGVEVSARPLNTGTLNVDASGGCELDLAASDALSVDASGGVEVTVHGHPAQRQVSTSGAAAVRFLD
jgi:hypothetical protein